MRVAIVNLLMRTVRSTRRLPQLDATLPRAGVEAVDPMAVMVADEIARLGHDVDIYSGSMFKVVRSEPSDGRKQSRIRYLDESLRFVFPPSYYPFTPSLVKELREEGYDAVLSGEVVQPSTMLASWGAPSRTRLYVWQELGSHPRFPINVFGEAEFACMRSSGFDRISRFIPRSRSARDYLAKEGVPDSKMSKVIPNGVDCRLFRPNQEQDFFSKRAMTSAPHPRVIMISRIVRDKGIETFLNAAKILKDEGVMASFILKGSGPDTAMVKELADRLGIADRLVRIEEYLSRPDLANLMASCDICAAPSEGDLLFFVPLEAIASGVPAIVSNATHHVHTFADGQAGRAIPPRDPSALANALRDLLEDEGLRKKMAKAARQLAVDEFSIESVGKRLAAEMEA